MAPTTTEALPTYCCCCDSRAASLNANIALLILSSIYFAATIAGINDTTSAEELLQIEISAGVAGIQIIIYSLAVWGACTYRGWPVMLSFGWLSVNMIVTGVAWLMVLNMTGSLGIFLVGFIALSIKYSCWAPMYGYSKEREKIKELSAVREMEKSDGAKQNLELV